MQKADQVGQGGGYHLRSGQKTSVQTRLCFRGETILGGLFEMDQVCFCVLGWVDQKSRSISDPHQS